MHIWCVISHFLSSYCQNSDGLFTVSMCIILVINQIIVIRASFNGNWGTHNLFWYSIVNCFHKKWGVAAGVLRMWSCNQQQSACSYFAWLVRVEKRLFGITGLSYRLKYHQLLPTILTKWLLEVWLLRLSILEQLRVSRSIMRWWLLLDGWSMGNIFLIHCLYHCLGWIMQKDSRNIYCSLSSSSNICKVTSTWTSKNNYT